MPGSTLPADQSRTMNSVLERLERLERVTRTSNAASTTKFRLEDLTDVYIPGTPGGSHVLYYDGTVNLWLEIDPGLLLELDDLRNVNMGSKTDGDVVYWDAGTGKWKNIQAPSLVGTIPGSGTVGAMEVTGENTDTLEVIFGPFTTASTFRSPSLTIDGGGALVSSGPGVYAVTMEWNFTADDSATFDYVFFEWDASSGVDPWVVGDIKNVSHDASLGQLFTGGSVAYTGFWDTDEVIMPVSTGLRLNTHGDASSSFVAQVTAHVLQLF